MTLKKGMIQHMKQKAAKLIFVVLTLIILVLTIIFLYYIYHYIFNDETVYETVHISIVIGVLSLLVFFIQKLANVAYPEKFKPSNTSQEVIQESSSQTSLAAFSQSTTTSINTSQIDKTAQPKTNLSSTKTLTKSKINSIFIIVITIIVIVFVGNMLFPGKEPIEGIWINGDSGGPLYWDDYDHVYLNISEFYDVYGYGTLTINSVTLGGIDYVEGSGLWYKEDNGYRLEITVIGEEKEIFYVYIVGNELYLTQTQTCWGFIKSNE